MKPAALTTAVLTALVALLPACTHTDKKEHDTQKPVHHMMSEDEAAAQMGNPLLANKGDPNAVNYHVTTSEELEKIDNGADGEIYWTDPNDPDKEIEGITAAFEARRNGNGWLTDYGRALRFAHRECRPMMIWFHDSVISPKSSRLGQHLLDTPKFNDWCKDRVVRVKLDSGASIAEDSQMRGSAKYSRNAINGLALRYGLRKKPALAVVAPTGRLMLAIDGYDGFTEGIEHSLKQGVTDAEKEMVSYRAKLADKGYRTWRSANGQMTLFAKLQRYDAEHRMVYLKEYGGRITRTKLSRFSEEDVEYLQERQEKKGKTL